MANTPRDLGSIASGAGIPSARWYLNRLRCMQPKEIPHRIARALTARVEHLVPWESVAPAPNLAAPETPWICAAPA
ncbi:MAG TPA: hypothetical protein VKA43_14730, partial [Gammaproteobacteria bacterium]|nr:hypothetical protein [Gammaproteobacteria bacterium]